MELTNQNTDIHFRKVLKETLVDRIKKNTSYSMRSFSRDIGLSSSFLSQILNGHRSLSEEKSRLIAKKIGLTGKRKKLFLSSVLLENTKDLEAKEDLYNEIEKQLGIDSTFSSFTLDNFKLVSDWYHMAILELTEIHGFKSKPNWIAKRLGIKRYEAETAVERLIRLGLLSYKNEKLRKTKNNKLEPTPSEAIRKFHKQHLKKSNLAMDNQKFNERCATGITMAINPEKLNEAFERISEFKKEMSELFDSKPKQKVYHLGIQLYQLDTGDPK